MCYALNLGSRSTNFPDFRRDKEEVYKIKNINQLIVPFTLLLLSRLSNF